MKTKTKVILSILGVVILAIVLIIGSLGFVPGLSTVLGANKPRDLGVTYTKQDYVSGMQKLGFVFDKSAGTGPNTKLVFSSTTKKVDAVLTNAELSALLTYDHSDRYPVHDAQVKVNPDGTIEVSAGVVLKEYKGINFDNAAYFKGKISKESSKSVSIEADKIEAGRVAVPEKEKVVQEAEKELNARLAKIPGLSIDTLEVTGDGNLRVQGTIPDSAKRVQI
jgi:hypothetical protein